MQKEAEQANSAFPKNLLQKFADRTMWKARNPRTETEITSELKTIEDPIQTGTAIHNR